MFSDIRKGFFIGLGFVIPLFFVFVLMVMYAAYEMSSFTNDLYDDAIDGVDIFSEGDDSLINEVMLSPVTETLQGTQLLIAGQFTNESGKELNSLEIEVELFDEKGTFVYECSKSFYEKIPVGLTENYLVKCGCSKHGVPDFSDVKVRVTKASVY